MSDIADKYYGKDGALAKIGDLAPFIDLAQEMSEMAVEGRINDMRRRLVVFTVERDQQRLDAALAALPEPLDFGDGYGGMDPTEVKAALTAALAPDNSSVEEKK